MGNSTYFVILNPSRSKWASNLYTNLRFINSQRPIFGQLLPSFSYTELHPSLLWNYSFNVIFMIQFSYISSAQFPIQSESSLCLRNCIKSGEHRIKGFCQTQNKLGFSVWYIWTWSQTICLYKQMKWRTTLANARVKLLSQVHFSLWIKIWYKKVLTQFVRKYFIPKNLR